jgi:hypothetical protein
MRNFRQFRKYSSNFKEISNEWISNEKKTKFITLDNEKFIVTNQMIETYQQINKKLEIEPNVNNFSGLYLTGPKNTGKTTTLKAIIQISSKINENWIIYHMVCFFLKLKKKESCSHWVSLEPLLATIEFLKVIKKSLETKNLLQREMKILPNHDTFENFLNLGLEYKIDPFLVLSKTFKELKNLEFGIFF